MRRTPSGPDEDASRRAPRRSSGLEPVDVGTAYWCERTAYASMDFESVTHVERYAVASAADAVRRIRLSVRQLALGLPLRERNRAIDWINNHGYLAAVAALHRGEPCGFSLSTQGSWVEWTIHPFLRFEVPARRGLPLL
jgi:hypothetical protein